MARPERRYVCQACGAVQPKWSGRCEDCGAWNTILEEPVEAAVPGGLKPGRAARIELVPLEGAIEPPPRITTAIDELDRVLGGGLVPASTVLIGGDPGIGKSTLMLQLTAALARSARRVAYVSGEESVDQIRLRARRLGLASAPVEVAAATSVRDLVATLDRADAPELLVVDSIQTMYADTVEAAPGTVGQLRTTTQELIRFAKKRGTVLILIGHVTKDGQIAGPRVLEHMVDAVLYFEGERGHQFRLLRAVKNRFGPANEIGVFEMREQGLVPVANPSALFLAEREEGVTGAVVFAGIEGTRPVLVEVQALVGPQALGSPRRAVIGWDPARLAMVLAVLEARCGIALAGRDIYLNVAGGLRITEPAADLAVAAALLSSLDERPAPPRSVFFGEIGLGGEVRAVTQAEARAREAAKLGFARLIVPAELEVGGIEPVRVRRVQDLVELIGAGGLVRPRRLGERRTA
jgi:DNA repair protein RadA/Sms